MTRVEFPFHSGLVEFSLPVKADILRMNGGTALQNPEEKIVQALENPIGSQSLREITRKKLLSVESAEAVIVISDNTRPVPYTGKSGILLPIINQLIEEGVSAEHITVLSANGTHRNLEEAELREMIDPAVFDLGVNILNHDCRDTDNLSHLGQTSRGTEIYINSRYINADIKILTGLVESHFMAGASGGRKSICPGLIGEPGTFIFHGPEMLGNSLATDLVLDGNPCHEESLEVAKRAGADFIVNVTLDSEFAITGVFAGDLEEAHKAAVARIAGHVGIPCNRTYDVVISHAGFVGINHYQAAKTGTVAMKLLAPGGYAVLGADTVDAAHPIGAVTYRTAIQLLKLLGPEKFMRLIKSDGWEFIPEQWQVQMWCKLFDRIPMDHFYYYSPQFRLEHYDSVPGIDGSRFVSVSGFSNGMSEFYLNALEDIAKRMKREVSGLSVAVLPDGPYGIPIIQDGSSVKQ